MNRLIADEPANLALVERLRKSGEFSEAALIGFVVGQSNDQAKMALASSLSQDSAFEIAFAGTLLGMAAGGGARPGQGVGSGAKGGDKFLWSSWKDYPKVSDGGKIYAQVGDRLYTEHAVNRMQPSGLGAPAGEKVPGRNVSPNLVDDVIRSGQPVHTVVDGIPRTVYWSGNVGVVTENSGKLVVTILRRASE